MKQYALVILNLIALSVSLELACAEVPDSKRPNIVVIFIDDMGFADPSCFGNPLIKTPHIDKLAAEGIKLTNFYVNSPICSASRVALTTGQYQGRWKIHSFLNTRAGNANRGMADYLDPSAPTTAKKLKAAGYATAHFGKWHMGQWEPGEKIYGVVDAARDKELAFEGAHQFGWKLQWLFSEDTAQQMSGVAPYLVPITFESSYPYLESAYP